MGLFDKRDKKRGKDDFDSPVEQIDLSQVPAAAPARTVTAEPPPKAEPVAARAPEPAAPTPAPEPSVRFTARAPEPVRATPETDDYGIDKAIELMRTLPQENVELVVQVVKFSLESVGIKLPVIIEDAIRRQNDIQGRIGVLKGEIAELEQEIKQRKDEIDRLEADHKETTMVRERLELAENLGKPAKADAKSDGAAKDSGKDAVAAPSSSGNLPRVTKQTSPPPVGASSSSSSSLGSLPSKK